ncbi:hypothetical protein K7X08_010831 [Anisodus acutangulus]|uniref:Uncharacterized protein n=1 Tax=Anisodus acutangulus TaxID=402998 RepID=A0A9Q1LZK8_9SOLA|nr:hypothetical protein K7X08_010831 [Anisodus acutangulus]
MAFFVRGGGLKSQKEDIHIKSRDIRVGGEGGEMTGASPGGGEMTGVSPGGGETTGVSSEGGEITGVSSGGGELTKGSSVDGETSGELATSDVEEVGDIRGAFVGVEEISG